MLTYLKVLDELRGALAQGAMVDDLAPGLQQQQVVESLRNHAPLFETGHGKSQGCLCYTLKNMSCQQP